jgi:hypothetical protein
MADLMVGLAFVLIYGVCGMVSAFILFSAISLLGYIREGYLESTRYTVNIPDTTKGASRA